jgi:hypothetical protein
MVDFLVWDCDIQEREDASLIKHHRLDFERVAEAFAEQKLYDWEYPDSFDLVVLCVDTGEQRHVEVTVESLPTFSGVDKGVLCAGKGRSLGIDESSELTEETLGVIASHAGARKT